MTVPARAAAPASPALRAPEPRWIPPEPRDSAADAELSRHLELPPALCAVLRARGVVEPEDAKRHLRPRLEHLHPPDLLRDADVATRRLLRAREQGEVVLVHGDYDVDGISGAALLTRWLRRLGVRVVPFVPHRLRDGYDFGEAGLERARACGATLIVTVDCGIVAERWIAEAVRAGIDVVVTDHHAPGASLPPALAVVNPNRSDCVYPDDGLCGTGVAFKLCQLLARACGVDDAELLPHLDLVALATVADLVPLRGENRVLTRFGLRALADTTKPGLRALLDVTGLEGRVGAGKVGFVLAPRINAVGRLGDADDGLRLLLTDSADDAHVLATRLDDINRRRQDEDRRTLDEALAMLAEGWDPAERFAVVLAREGWHPGVIGIVASRIVERVHRPTVLVALDGEHGRGSARSIPGFHLHEALEACSGHLQRFGGHAMAAGMDIAREGVDAFAEAFARVARERLAGAELLPVLRLDAEIELGEVTLDLCHFLAYLGPHGIGNPRPVFLTRGVSLAREARVVGRGHLKVELEQGGARVSAIGFGLAERIPPASLSGPLDATFALDVNEYRGVRSPQAVLKDLRPANRPA